MPIRLGVELLQCPILHQASLSQQEARTCDLSTRPCSALGEHDEFIRITLSVVRYIAAAYLTSDAACWEAAFRFAEEAIGSDHGPALIARAAMLVRAMRRIHERELACLPAPCNRLTAEEKKIVELIEVAREGSHCELLTHVATMVDTEYQAEVMHIARGITELSLSLRSEQHMFVPTDADPRAAASA